MSLANLPVQIGKRTPFLDNKEAERVLRYVSYLLRELLLTQWTIVLSDVPTEPLMEGDPPSEASIRTHSDRYMGYLQLHKDWKNRTDQEKSEILVHEMLHLATRELRDRIHMWMMVIGGKIDSLSGCIMADTDSAEERLVDHLATILAPRLPQYPGPLSAPIPTVRRER